MNPETVPYSSEKIDTFEEEALLQLNDLFRNTQELLRQLASQFPPNNIVGIPSIDGMEFFKVEEIVRCEGLQRLTKVFTRSDIIISSYNIGQFNRLLCPLGFFAPHKSHLINLQYLRCYRIEGSIILRDGTRIPLARRRREAFLKCMRHL